MIALWLLTGVLGKEQQAEVPAIFYQPGGFYFPADRRKKRREVIDEAVEEAVEIVTASTRAPISEAQIAAIAARIRKVVPPAPAMAANTWRSDHSAIMVAIDAEIARLIEDQRIARDEYDDMVGLLLMAS